MVLVVLLRSSDSDVLSKYLTFHKIESKVGNTESEMEAENALMMR